MNEFSNKDLFPLKERTVISYYPSGRSFKTIVQNFDMFLSSKIKPAPLSENELFIDIRTHLFSSFEHHNPKKDCPTCLDSTNMTLDNKCFDCGEVSCTNCSIVIKHSAAKNKAYVCTRCCILRSDIISKAQFIRDCSL